MEYTEIVKAIDEYNAKPTEEIQREMQEIYITWKHQGLHILAKQAGISKAMCYQMVKRCVKYRPSFESYVRIKAVGKNVYYKGLQNNSIE